MVTKLRVRSYRPDSCGPTQTRFRGPTWRTIVYGRRLTCASGLLSHVLHLAEMWECWTRSARPLRSRSHYLQKYVSPGPPHHRQRYAKRSWYAGKVSPDIDVWRWHRSRAKYLKVGRGSYINEDITEWCQSCVGPFRQPAMSLGVDVKVEMFSPRM